MNQPIALRWAVVAVLLVFGAGASLAQDSTTASVALDALSTHTAAPTNFSAPLPTDAETVDYLTSLSAILSPSAVTSGPVPKRTTLSEDLAGTRSMTMGLREPASIPPIIQELVSTDRKRRRYTPTETILQALEFNRDLAVQRLNPRITATNIDTARAQFDPTISASATVSETKRSRILSGPNANVDAQSIDSTAISRATNVTAGMSVRAPTGTNLTLTADVEKSKTSSSGEFYTSDINLNITQNLLRGFGPKVNLAQVRIAENNLQISRYELETYLINLVSDSLVAYCDLYLAAETLRIRLQAHKVAREQRERVDQFARFGGASAVEGFAARAEESARVADVITAAAQLQVRQLRFLRAVSSSGTKGSFDAIPIANVIPPIPSEKLQVAERVKLGQKLRPDLKQAELELKNSELQVVQTKNGLLPQLDLRVDVGQSAVADTFSNVTERISPDLFGASRGVLEFSYPLGNRAARAADRRATFRRDQAEAAIKNQQQQIELEVREAAVEVERSRQLLSPTKATREFREQQLQVEIERFRVGSGTQLEVNQAQRDLTASQLDEVSARVALAKACYQLYRAEGTALARTGIIAMNPVSSEARR